MAIKITLKNSVVENSVPTTTHLAAVGELALNANINSLGIYMRASDNTIVKMAGPGSLTTPAASTTVAGISEYATNTETTTGTATDRTVTPAGLAAVTSAERSTSNSTYLALAGGTLAGVLQATAGSNSAPAIHFGDSDSGIFGGTNTVSLAAGGTTKLTAATDVSVFTSLLVDGDGLRLKLGDAQDFQLYHTGTTNKIESFVGDIELLAPTSKAITFGINQSESARIDSSGRLLVGSSSAIPVGSTASALSQFHGTANALVGSFVGYANNSGGAVVSLGKSRGAIATPGTTVQDNDNLGTIRFAGDDGTDIQTQAALFECNVDGTVASNQIPAEFVLKTAASDGTMTTRLTIDSAGLVNVPDNGKFTAGAGNDLQISHTGSYSLIFDSNNQSDLFIQTNERDITLKVSTTENAIVCKPNSAVELYYDNSKKLETNSEGINVTSTADAVLQVTTTGTAGFHDSRIELITQESTFQIQNDRSLGTDGALTISDGTDTYLQATKDAEIGLYYDNSKKLETLNYGVRVTGQLVMAQDYIKLDDTVELRCGNGDDLQIYHDGSNSYLKTTAGHMFHDSQYNQYFRNQDGSDTRAVFAQDGACELYYDNSKKFETYTSGVRVPADNTVLALGAGSDFRFWHNGTHNIIKGDTGSIYTASSAFLVQNAAQTENYIIASENSSAQLYYDNSKKFETTTQGVEVSNGTGSAHLNLRAGSGNVCYLNFIADNNEDWNDNSRIKGSEGEMHVELYNGSAWEKAASFLHGDAAYLFFNDSRKFETTSGGAKVTGFLNLTAGLHVPDGSASGDSSIVIGTHNDFRLFHSSANSHIYHNGTGNFFIEAVDANITLRAGNNAGGTHDSIVCTNNAGVKLYYDSGSYTDPKLETTVSGVKVTGYGNSPNNSNWATASSITTSGSYGGGIAMIDGSAGFVQYCHGSGANWELRSGADDATPETNIKATHNGAVELYYDNGKKFSTTSDGALIHGRGQIGGNMASAFIGDIQNDGNNANRYGLQLRCGADDGSGTNYAVAILTGNGTTQGYITFSGGTVTYGTFTAYHPCIVPDSENPSDNSNAYPYGTLLETISIEYTQKNGSDTERGIRYKVQKTQSANSRKVLGAYGSSMNGGPDGQTNEHQALVLGDGHILVNNAGGNIEVGDGICSSATAGIGQKATANPSMIIGIAQEAITFTGSETKLVAVQYGLQQFIPWT